MLKFSNIASFFKRNKKILYYTGFFVLLFMIGGDGVFAGNTMLTNGNGGGSTLGTVANPITSAVSTSASLAEAQKVQGWMSSINSIMAGVAGLLALFTYLATMFLDPAWLNGSIFGMTSNFKEIWILVSNVVYFIFAFILIWIAFMNIIGKGDKWELKAALPKFIIGVLIVPFSWFFIQFILSLSAILTASVITLPIDTFSKYDTKLNEVKIPNECIINFASITTKGNTTKNNTGTGIISCNGEVSLKKALTGNNIQGAIFGTIATYTYGVVNIKDLGTLKQKDLLKIKTLGDLIFKVIFDVLFVIVFAILIITLGLVLVVRGIYIWIYIMMSPIFGLMYFFDKKEGGGEGMFGKFNLKEFIALAMVPVYVMAALSFGFLFMSVVAKGIFTPTESSKISLGEKGNSISIGKEFKLKIIGTSTSGNGKLFNALKAGTSGAIGIIGAIIMQLFSVVILRGAVMAALRTSEITKTITQPIYDFGNQVGGLVAKTPMYAPVFGGKSATELSSGSSALQSSIHSHYTGKGSEWGQSMSPFDSSSATKLKTVNMQHLKDQNNLSNVESHINDMSKNITDLNSTLKKPSEKAEFMEMIKMKFGDDLYKAVKDSTTEDNFYASFRSNYDKIVGQGGIDFKNRVLNGKNTPADFASVFEGENIPNGNNPNGGGNKVRLETINGDLSKIVGVGNKDITLKVSNNKFEINNPNDIDELAKGIGNLKINEQITQDFSIELIDDLKKYFDDKGKFIKSGEQENGNFPWEIDNSSND